jgi:hypothetical protein
MRRIAILAALAGLAACGAKHNASLCDQNPPPPACSTSCDPTPGAPNDCPAGFHCTPDGFCDAECTPGGNECGDNATCTPDGLCMGMDSCTGIGCNVVDCAKMGQPPTSVSGTVFAPNGTLPLYGVYVYVPDTDPGPFSDQVTCDKCSDGLPGDPVAYTQTDETGHFSLANIPVGDNIPVVVTTGRWRRQLVIPHVGQCADTPIAATDTTLPKSRDDLSPLSTSVDMPRIAISTGSADALECLIRKLGIADKEIGTDGTDTRIHLWADQGAGGGEGVASFKNGGGNFADSGQLWGTSAANKLSNYDIVFLSCEGAQHAETKNQQSMNNLKAYADVGGRVFLSHWHNIWLEGDTQDNGGTSKPQVWPGIATFDDAGGDLGNGTKDTIDEANNPLGGPFATWMVNVMGSPTKDVVPIQDGTGRNTCVAVDTTKAEEWVRVDAANNPDGFTGPQMIQFTTPNEVQQADRCGKVAFSDMHVSGDSSSPTGGTYPDSCASSGLTPQEKALAFMFFEIASCVGNPIF